MTRLLRRSGLIWTACAAGWLVLGYITGLASAYLVGVGCLTMAVRFYNMASAYKE